jgi:hypothetical protein
MRTRWTAGSPPYGAWLASLADEPGLLGATVIVESAPDTGVRLRATVAAKADPRGHPVSLAVLRESADTFATGTPQSTVWVTLTYETPGAKTGLTGPAEELVDRITGLAAGLAGTGVDDARPATAQELCEEMLVAYDPARQADIDAARVAAADDTTPILALSWEDVGPVTATAPRSYYQHDSGASITWEMSEAPRGVHYANILAALVAPQRGLRKRVALHYQVVPPWEAAALVQKDVRTTEFRASQSKRPSARVTTEVRAAHQTAAEESAGAALLTVGLTLTATATDTVEGLHGLPVPATHQLPAGAHRRRQRLGDRPDPAAPELRGAGLRVPEHLPGRGHLPPPPAHPDRAAGGHAMTRRPTAKTKRPTPRGWARPFGGYSLLLSNPNRWRSTSNQVCGMWPFAIGAGVPQSGAPLGDHLGGGGTGRGDPYSWFQDGYISSPSEVVIGLNGQGKSTLIAKQILCLEGMGVLPLVLGDLKGEYGHLITTIGGQVIDVGPGRGTVNPLDPGEAAAVAGLLAGEADRAVLTGNHDRAERMRTLRLQVLAEAHARAVSATSGLITILRGGTAPEEHEESVLSRGIRLLEALHDAGLPACPCPDKTWHRVGCPDRPDQLAPELRDLLDVITAGHPDLYAVAVAADRADYDKLTVRLRRSLTALVEGSSRLGDTFTGQTSTPMRRDRPVCVNISAIDDSQSDLQAAVLLASWAAGFAMVNVANVLADAGLEPRRHWFVVMDEFWRVLRSGAGMVDRADALTRLDRRKGVARAFIFHTMEDLEALPDDRTAQGPRVRRPLRNGGLLRAAPLGDAAAARRHPLLPQGGAADHLLDDPGVLDAVGDPTRAGQVPDQGRPETGAAGADPQDQRRGRAAQHQPVVDPGRAGRVRGRPRPGLGAGAAVSVTTRRRNPSTRTISCSGSASPRSCWWWVGCGRRCTWATGGRTTPPTCRARSRCWPGCCAVTSRGRSAAPPPPPCWPWPGYWPPCW